MELHPLESIALDRASQELISTLDETARKVNEFRPLSEEILDTVQRELLGERVYSSNAIEGNTCDIRETVQILTTGHITLSKKREATEVLNLGEAIKYAETRLGDPLFPSKVEEFLKVHKTLLKDIKDEWAGRFREHGVTIAGAKHQPPDHRYVPDMVSRTLEWLRQPTEASPVVVSTWLHWSIARIHPFDDGNGRMARLWQDVFLLGNRLSCAIIRPEDRRQYLDALAQADEGEFNPLVQLVAQRVATTLDKYISAQQEAAALSDWASEVAGEADARADESRRLAYLRWARKMESLRFAFERCAAKITQQSVNTEIQVRPHDLIDQAAWEGIRSGAGASRTWFFRVVFHKERRNLTYIFFLGKHFWLPQLDSERDRAEPRVCVRVSEQKTREEDAQRLGEDPANPLTLREVFLVDNEWVRKRFDRDKEEDMYDRGLEPVKIAQDFISEVLLLRMT